MMMRKNVFTQINDKLNKMQQRKEIKSAKSCPCNAKNSTERAEIAILLGLCQMFKIIKYIEKSFQNM